MMAVLELYGKCKELGSCDCEGFFGCHDPKPRAPKPVIENEIQNAMKAERDVSDYHNHNYWRELEVIEQSEGLVECEVCDRGHLSSHPHITNIEGDVPIDDPGPAQRKSSPVISLPPPDDQLPGWLRESKRPTLPRKTSPISCASYAASPGHQGMTAIQPRPPRLRSA